MTIAKGICFYYGAEQKIREELLFFFLPNW